MGILVVSTLKPINMTKEQYKNSKQIKEFLAKIEEAIDKKKKIQQNDTLTLEKRADEIAILSEDLMDSQIKLGTFIDKKYFNQFEEGSEITINPEEIKLALNNDENENDYEHVFAYSFGPFNTFKYLLSPKRFIVVDWEPYMLSSELESYRAKELPQIGGHLQAKEFPTYDKLEAETHTKAVDFCKLLMTKFSVDKTNDEIMRDHMCILEHNFFPALAFKNNLRSKQSYIKKFAEWNNDILSSLLSFYDGDIVIGHRDLLGYVGSYSGMFNVALCKSNPDFNGESTEILLNGYPNATIIGRKIIRSWFNHNLGGKGASALLDEKGKLWVGYVHFQSRRGDQWSAKDQEEMASWIHRILSEL